jgi:hypothetical protein
MKRYASHRTIEEGDETRMKRSISSAMGLAGFVALCALACAPPLRAQQQEQKPQQGTTAPAPTTKPTDTANPFPVDNNAVPVIGKSPESMPPPPSDNSTKAGADMPFDDTDPAKSPDEGAPSQDGGFSSSVQAAEPVVSDPDKEKKKRGRGDDDEIKLMPVAGPKEDENIGAYYLERKNWKAALSRFTSAMVLDPENPDVYWGLAEAERNMGQFAEARANYQKVVDFDPDSKHGKEAKKLLKTPEIANAKASAASAESAPQQ